MAERTVKCAKLGQELPAIDPESPAGRQALKMARLCGGPQLEARVRDEVSAEAWHQWTEFMLMVINEYQLDPTSDESNKVLGQQMERFFFGEGAHVPGYKPPSE